MGTAVFVFLIVLGRVGATVLAAMHFAPERLKWVIDSYYRLISFNPFR